MNGTELSELIARAQSRDPAAFDALVESYGPRLYGYFYRATGRRTDAEDLLQELFVRLVTTLADYRHEGRFEPWLFRIATNLLRDSIRRKRSSREQQCPPGEPADQGSIVGRFQDPQSGHPAERLGLREDLDRLGRAIQELPEPERMVILLRHFSQMPFREIAEMMDTPVGTALARAHRGLSRLRQLMDGEPEGLEAAEGVD